MKVRRLLGLTLFFLFSPSFPTVIVFGREEPDEGSDALPVLGSVEIVAPAVEVPVLPRVIAWQHVLVSGAGVQGRRAHDACHIDVRQAVGEVVDVDVDAVAGHLTLDAGVGGPRVQQ